MSATSLHALSWWQRLPREPRDTLFQLLVIGWTVLPHLAHLPAWCTALTRAVLAWRAGLAVAGAPLPGRWATAVVLAVAIGLTALQEHTLLGREAGVTLLVVLLGLKTLELRVRRDALVVFFLGFFLALTHCLYSQSLWVALAMGVSTWGLLTALVLAHMPVGRPPVRRAAAVAARSTLLGLPLMAALFVLFPRFGPLWGMPSDGLGRTGLSGSLRVGGMAEVANDDSIAFRIRFEGPPPSADSLYFRGPVLSQFDGLEWRRANPPVSQTGQRPGPELRLLGPPLRYQVVLEPIRLPLLPLLEATPARADSGPQLDGWTLQLRPDLQWQTDRLVSERLMLSASAWPRFEHGPRSANVATWREALQVPAGFNPRLREWAVQMRADMGGTSADARALASRLLRHVRDNDYVYTLQPGSYGRHAVDEFWFDRRQGFCEHYAVAFVLAMRAMEVPARIVTGYQGAEPADSEGWQVVRQSHAHAWAEYWQAGVGWVRADPTAAVAPERVRSSRPLAPTSGLMAGALRSFNPALFAQLRGMIEQMDNRWNRWILSYSRSQQFDLLQWLGVRHPDWSDLGLTLAGLLGAAGSAGALWAWWDRRRQDPWARLHLRLRDGLARLGVPSQPHHGPARLAAAVRQQLGVRAELLARQLDRLDALRYGPGGQRMPPRAWWRSYRQHWRLLLQAPQWSARFPQPQSGRASP